MHMEYFSFYLGRIQFLSTVCLPHIELVYVLLDLFLSVAFFVANLKDTMFLISNCNCSLLVHKKSNWLYVLILYSAALLYSLINSKRFFHWFSGIFYIANHVLCEQKQLYFSFLKLYTSYFLYLSYCINQDFLYHVA